MSLKPKTAPTETGQVCEKCGKPMVIRTSHRRQRFIACSGYPECKNAKSLTKDILEKIGLPQEPAKEKIEENDVSDTFGGE